jgi:hypothetical protein
MGESSRLPWQDILTHLFGRFSQSMKQAGFKGKKSNAKKRKEMYNQ